LDVLFDQIVRGGGRVRHSGAVTSLMVGQGSGTSRAASALPPVV